MKKIVAFTMLGGLFLSRLCALEFGSMGNTSAAMGGAGVALKHSAWGLYYNPALLSSDPKVKLGYSLGVGLREQNLAKLTTIDINNMSSTAERLIATFSGSGSGTITNVIQEALKGISTSSGGGGSGTSNIQTDLKNYTDKHPDGNYSELIQKILDQVQKNSSLPTDQKNLLGNIVGNIDYKNLDFSNGSGTGGTQHALQNITISKGGDKGLDKAVEDISSMQEILKDNNLNIVSQNGMILQISSKTMNEKLGSLGVAYFASAYSSMSINADSSKMRLIIKGGSGYYELVDNGGSFSFKVSDEDNYDKYSLIASLEGNSDAHKLVTTAFMLSEVPIGYARTFYLKHGNLNLGITGKLMNAISTQKQININKNTDFQKELTSLASLENTISSNNFGVDVGMLYELDLPEFRYLTFGLVAKNLNSPTFESSLNNITIKPQYRMGLGYNSKFLNVAFDADLTPNDLLAFSNVKQQSQMIGGGVGFDLKAMDLRLGAMKDLRQDTGLILTGGLNVLGFLDIALQVSTKTTKLDGIPIPQYINLRLGGSFSF
ncbi:conjugal transfer protein TraF [Helicobacter cinaedi]|uniref:conjugal transfer protein TraF n=1 Tax=Helicobacter cinaedi TaxID=213 RepID=UPI000DC6F5D0|nr:conjugal transfer protein TraF [Helicobacter cinaedi]BBB20701.1 predicted secreted protein [Helicobacter cinaedi]